MAVGYRFWQTLMLPTFSRIRRQSIPAAVTAVMMVVVVSVVVLSTGGGVVGVRGGGPLRRRVDREWVIRLIARVWGSNILRWVWVGRSGGGSQFRS